MTSSAHKYSLVLEKSWRRKKLFVASCPMRARSCSSVVIEDERLSIVLWRMQIMRVDISGESENSGDLGKCRLVLGNR